MSDDDPIVLRQPDGFLDIDAVFELLRRCRRYIEQVNHDAEARHDTFGEFYMDGGLYETMRETGELIRLIDEVTQ